MEPAYTNLSQASAVGGLNLSRGEGGNGYMTSTEGTSFCRRREHASQGDVEIYMVSEIAFLAF